MYNVTNEFPLFFRFIAIKIGQKSTESSDVILPRPLYKGMPTNTQGQSDIVTRKTNIWNKVYLCKQIFFLHNINIFFKIRLSYLQNDNQSF